jgi:RHS repeat-associated protein
VGRFAAFLVLLFAWANLLSSGAQVDFVYDLASNLVKEVYQKQGGSNRTGDRFPYDEHHRLHKAWLGADTTLMQDANPETSTGSFVEKLTYGLDAAQNRTTLQRQAGSGGSIGAESYSVQEAGEPQGASNRYDQVGAVAPTYDQRGNTTFDGNFYYVYDEQNRLSEVYILSGDSAARSTSTTSLAAEAPTGSTREQTRRGRFAVPDVVVLQRARQRLLARATGGPEEILRRHAEPAFVRQLREPLGNGAARRVVAGGSESLQSRSSGTGEGGVEEDVELQLLAVYLYDVFDRRVLRVVVGVQTWGVAWDGWQEAEELVPTWQNGLVMAPQRQFVWGEQLDELVGYRYRNPSTNTWAAYFVAEGGAHCPQRVLDGSGQVVEVQEYDPYGGTSFFDGAGAPVGAASQVGNPFGWKAVRIDPETGLCYMRHRYYAPQWGRFLTQDPLGVWGDPVNLGNGYAYVGNMVLILSDRFGLQTDSGLLDVYNAFVSWNRGFWSDMTWGVSDWIRGKAIGDPGEGARPDCFTVGEWSSTGVQLLSGVGAGKVVGREVSERMLKEAFKPIEKTLAELTEKSLREAADKAKQELAQKLEKEAAEKLEKEVEKGAKDLLDDAAREGVRTAPRNLTEKLTLDEARGGAGKRIMQGRINDPKYPEGLWAKMQHVHEQPDGSQTVIHYWENIQTGAREGFKFK